LVRTRRYEIRILGLMKSLRITVENFNSEAKNAQQNILTRELVVGHNGRILKMPPPYTHHP
jgi:hypothetical protein